MAGSPPPYPPRYPPPGDWRNGRKLAREQAKAQRDYTREQWKLQREQQRLISRGMRGGSLLGPVLLIFVGIVFLLIKLGRLDYGQVGRWYEHWWPLLLLLGGVVLLGEWAFERTRAPGTYFGRRVGGGVVVPLFLLCLPGIGMSASHGNVDFWDHGFSINHDNIEGFLGDRHESDASLNEVFPAGATLTINNPHGDVTLAGTSEDGQIHVAVHKEVVSRSDSDASSKASRLAPSISVSGSSVTLTVAAVEGGRADLTVSIPAGAGAVITVDHGGVQVNSLRAALTVTANHGDIELNAIGGPVTTHINNRGSSFNARAVTGGLTLEGDCRDVDVADISGPVSLSGDFFGKTHLERIAGALRFHTSRTDFQLGRLDGEVDITHGDLSADQIVGPVSMSARSYNVTLDRVSGDVSVTTSDGSVDVTSAPPIGNVTIENRNGAVNLTLPNQAAFSMQAATRDGDIQTDFPLTHSEENSTSRLNGTVGQGGSVIRINTSQNDISVKRGVIAPLSAPQVPTTPTAPPAPVAPSRKAGRKASAISTDKVVTTF